MEIHATLIAILHSLEAKFDYDYFILIFSLDSKIPNTQNFRQSGYNWRSGKEKNSRQDFPSAILKRKIL